MAKQISMSKMKGKQNGKDDKHEILHKIDETDEMKLKLIDNMNKQDSEDMLYPPELNAHLIEQLKVSKTKSVYNTGLVPYSDSDSEEETKNKENDLRSSRRRSPSSSSSSSSSLCSSSGSSCSCSHPDTPSPPPPPLPQEPHYTDPIDKDNNASNVISSPSQYNMEFNYIMTCENNELRKCVFTKDQELKELNKTISDLNQRIRDIISGSGPAISSKSAGIISAKITDLCKQNRHLVAELEGYKTKNASLERKVLQLEIINKEHAKLDVCVCKNENIDSNPDELKELNNKLAIVNKKLYDSKNRNLELKNDILLATKILQQELGDKFTSIKELQHDLAGWKGRAQQILSLQSKIAELEEKLGKQKEVTESNRKDQPQIIRDIEIKRKKEIELAIKSLDTYKVENQDLKKKLDGAKCRIRNLECDATTVRQKMQMLIEKSQHDDMLINEQRNQIKSLELYYQEILKENTSKMNKMHAEIAEYQKLVQNTDAKIDALRKQATEKATKIDELRAQLLRYEECSLQSVFFTPMKTATDNEIKKLSELVVALNERLNNERRKWDELEVAHQKCKEKKRKLNRRVATLEEELKNAREVKKSSKASRSSIPREVSDNYIGSMAKRSSSVVADKNVAAPFEYQASEDNSDDLKFKLELAEEKLKIMEDKLRMIEEEKVEDFNNLTEMIQTSKQLFHEALAVLQREKCVCS